MSLLHHRKKSPGILQSSNISSQVLDPRIPNLSNFWAVRNPETFFSTINAVIFLLASVSLFFVLAYTYIFVKFFKLFDVGKEKKSIESILTTTTSASGPFVIQNLFPFST